MSFVLLGILNSQVDAAGGGAYELIESNILTASASSVTFSSIPQDYKHLQIRMTPSATTSNGTRNLRIRYNGDTNTANFNSHALYNSGSGITSEFVSGSAIVGFQVWPDPNASGNSIIDILDYSSTSKNKTHRYLYGVYGGQIRVQFGSGLWQSTAAISSLTIEQWTGFFMAAGSRFSLYGIRG